MSCAATTAACVTFHSPATDWPGRQAVPNRLDVMRRGLVAVDVGAQGERLHRERADVAPNVHVQRARAAEQEGCQDLRRVPLGLEAQVGGQSQQIARLLWRARRARERVRRRRPRRDDRGAVELRVHHAATATATRT
eukprot:2817302-Prymnesium_polylepis.1